MIAVVDVDLEVQLYNVANHAVDFAYTALGELAARKLYDDLQRAGIVLWSVWPRGMVADCAREIYALLPADPAIAAARLRLESLIAQSDGQLSLF